MIASEVLMLSDFILNDSDYVTYTKEDRVRALNSACMAIIIPRPDACVGIDPVELRKGPHQKLPEGSLRLLEPCYLLDEEGNRQWPVELIVRSEQDRLDPDWIHQAQTTEIIEIMYDERTPQHYWVNPPAEEGTRLELATSVRPDPMTAMDSEFPMSDKYATVAMEWVLYLLFSRDSEHSTNQARAASHRSNFYTLLGMKGEAEQLVSPVGQSTGGG